MTDSEQVQHCYWDGREASAASASVAPSDSDQKSITDGFPNSRLFKAMEKTMRLRLHRRL